MNPYNEEQDFITIIWEVSHDYIGLPYLYLTPTPKKVPGAGNLELEKLENQNAGQMIKAQQFSQSNLIMVT